MFRLKVFCLLLFVMLAFTGCSITINTASDTTSASLYVPPTDVSASTQPSSFRSYVPSTAPIEETTVQETTERTVQDTTAEKQFVYDGTTTDICIDVVDYGCIYVTLYDELAPVTVSNFKSLISEGFYDGLTFHRIIDGFMIQGGDPNGNGTGGSENQIKGEFSANGVENNLKHTRGVISMACSSDMNSASSQFFIMHADAPHLDGQYASFGEVTDGMSVVDAIVRDAKPLDGNGTIAKDDQPVIRSIYII